MFHRELVWFILRFPVWALLGGSTQSALALKRKAVFSTATPSPGQPWKQMAPVLPSPGPGTSCPRSWNSDGLCRCDENPSSENIRSERSAFCHNSRHGTDFPGLRMAGPQSHDSIGRTGEWKAAACSPGLPAPLLPFAVGKPRLQGCWARRGLSEAVAVRGSKKA